MSVEPSAFARWLRQAMDTHDLNDRELAEKLGTATRSTVAHWRLYNETPKTESLLALAAVFGVDVLMLFDLAGVTPPPEVMTVRREPDSLRLPVIVSFDGPQPADRETIAWTPDQIISGVDQVFAVRMPNNLMAPTVMQGDIVIADRDRSPGPGDVVVVRGEAGNPEVWRLDRHGRDWRLVDATGSRVKAFSRNDLRGTLVALYSSRAGLRWQQ